MRLKDLKPNVNHYKTASLIEKEAVMVYGEKKRKDVDVGSMLGKTSGVLTSREIHRKKFNMKMKIMCCALKVCCG